MADQPVILWFRDDLRLADHPALQAAIATGRSIVAVHVLDSASDTDRPLGGAARWWLHHSLSALDQDLRARGARLVLRQGIVHQVLITLMRQTGASMLLAGRATTAGGRATDAALITGLGADRVRLFRTASLFDPDDVRTRAGGHYLVFTPFAQACLSREVPPALSEAPAFIPSYTHVESESLPSWRLTPSQPDWAKSFASVWSPGEAGARDRLDRFIREGLTTYAERRDMPAVEGGSLLSPHLRFGEIAPARIWQAMVDLPGSDAFLRELLWREFAIHLLWHHPSMPTQPLRPAFAAMPWRDDPAALRAWQRGRTGIPIVDAGMRQLWQSGWMHNRVRMIAGSFLVKQLLLPWQLGEAWFWDTLVDADPANNAMNWQWVAGCGADAAPYFRVFNPVTQGRRFDPDGHYVRKYVPELRELDTRHIHAPWEAPDQALRTAGLRLGTTYPEPIVDLAAGRQRALAAFATLRNGKAVT